MKKYILPVVIIALVTYIIVREVKIQRMNTQNKELSDSVAKMKSQLDWSEKSFYNDFRFNWIECTPIYDKIIKSEDSLNIKVVLTARNTVKDSSEIHEAFVTLGKYFDSYNNLNGVYDTIYSKDWLCEMKIKTHGIGKDSLLGIYNIPWKNNSILSYSFRINYLKVDNKTYNDILKFKK